MKEFWDQRYSSEDYAYGVEPNAFYKEEVSKLKPGKILFPAEGEGRNAIFAATLGWEVAAYDVSTEGIKKAENLAKKNNVEINYKNASHESFQAEPESFDCIVLIYAHSAPGKRQLLHQKLAGFLKPGGTLILEGFSKQQLKNNTGGPRNIDMLFSVEELKDDFRNFKQLDITKTEVGLSEGYFHQGNALVVRTIGTK
ncbi:MAG: class I SAM-dependent methyltransferase [Mariniphaga sp.]|nr:class I SAM-dependent methyltransferase [Mariniphaga sp.]